MSKRKNKLIKATGIESSEAFGRPTIKVITKENFEKWRKRLVIAAFLLNLGALGIGIVPDHFIRWPLGAGIGIIVGVIFFFPVFFISKKSVKEFTIIKESIGS